MSDLLADIYAAIDQVREHQRQLPIVVATPIVIAQALQALPWYPADRLLGSTAMPEDKAYVLDPTTAWTG